MKFIPVSVGELIDKITILQLKASKISDAEPLKNIEFELKELMDIAFSIGISPSDTLMKRLFMVNSEIWVLEDDIRLLPATDKSGIVCAAKSIIEKNDLRFMIKREINEKFASKIIEEKSYQYK